MSAFPGEPSGRFISGWWEIHVDEIHLLLTKPLILSKVCPGEIYYRCFLPKLQAEDYPYECVIERDDMEVQRSIELSEQNETRCPKIWECSRLYLQNLSFNRSFAESVNELAGETLVVGVYVKYGISIWTFY